LFEFNHQHQGYDILNRILYYSFDHSTLSFLIFVSFGRQGFLTAMRQEVTRKHEGWALDEVILHNEVTRHNREDLRQEPSEGIYVYGLFIDGAAWDR
jgi:dynein heavy chain